VNVGGGALPSVRVEVNPTKLASYGLTMANLQSVLSLQNSDSPKGRSPTAHHRGHRRQRPDLARRRLQAAGRRLQQRRGGPLSDVADVIDSCRTSHRRLSERQARRHDHHFRQPGANIIETVDRIRAQLPSLKASIPQWHRHHHRSGPHHHHPRLGQRRRADADHLHRAGHRVVFVFLRNGRATLIPSVAVPSR
jgi:multidrug efflux pump